MEQSTSSELHWNPTILADAFDEATWVEIQAIISTAAGKAIDRKGVVEYVAALPWHTVTAAVSYGFGGIAKKQLVGAIELAVRRANQ